MIVNLVDENSLEVVCSWLDSDGLTLVLDCHMAECCGQSAVAAMVGSLFPPRCCPTLNWVEIGSASD